MGSQTLDKKTGQPILTDKKCSHGVFCDARGNNACELCLEHGRTGSYLVGIVAGWDEVHEMAKARAGAAYADGDDAKAKFWRDLSKEAEKTSAERRKAYEAHKHEDE